MAKQLQLRRGTTTEHATFTGAEAEVTVDTTKDVLVVHDGVLAGGHPLAKDSLVVHLAGAETITGVKTFSAQPVGITKASVGLGNVANTAQVTAVTGTAPIVSSGGTTPVISHSTADGNLHVPATSTTNNGKVLTAGATAGSISWVTPAATDLTVTAGTTAGPTINSSTGADVVIPSASATASGVVTTGAQTFAGVKTMTSPVFVTPSIGVATGTSFNSITGLASVAPVMDGVAAIGTSAAVARQDHVHPSDTSKTNAADLMMAIGNINAPLLDLNLMTAKTAQQYEGEFRFERSTGAGYVNSFGQYVWNDVYSGTATSGSLFSLDKTDAGWVAGALVDYVLKVTTGGVTEYRWVIGNTATSVSLNKPLSTPVTSSSTYLLSKPRFDANGYVNEGSSTNLLSWTKSLHDTTKWSVGSTLGNYFTVTNETTLVSPDGAVGGVAKFVARTTTAKIFLRKSGLSLSTSTTYSSTIWVYVPTQSGITAYTISVDYNDTDISYRNSSVFDKWVAIPVSTLLTASRTLVDFNIGPNGLDPVTGFTFYASQPQLEAAPFATRYIPNNTAGTMTRNADVLSINTSGILGLHSSDITVSSDWISDGLMPSSAPRAVHIQGDNALDNIILKTGANTGAKEAIVTKYPTSLGVFTVSDGAKYRQSASFNMTTGWVYKNGVLVETKSAPSTSGKLNVLFIGSQSGITNFHYGNIQRVRVYGKVLIEIEHALH